MAISFFYPMAALVFFTLLYGFTMFFVRVRSARSGETDPRYFNLMKGEPSELVLKTGQHFVNLFEVPVLFYAACLSFLALHVFSSAAYALAWVFFVSRVLHAYIHTTHNRVVPRLMAFMLGVLSVLMMWIFLFLEVRKAYG